MLHLYYKPTCPYCQRVLEANKTINASLVLRDILADEATMTELIEKGGKRQVPFLEDTDRGVSLYESLDIIEYLRVHYGQGKQVVVPGIGNVCPID